MLIVRYRLDGGAPRTGVVTDGWIRPLDVPLAELLRLPLAEMWALYLPQAKIYLGGCVLGPGIRPAWEVPDPYALAIRMTIRRDGGTAWSGEASTAQLHRRLDELAGFLFAADVFPDGAVLSTGTCLVPELPFTLEDGDQVEIGLGGVGALVTDVVRGLDALLARTPGRAPTAAG